MRAFARLGLLVAASLVAPAAAGANVWNTYGAGARNIAMGGATVASTVDWSSGQTNPAGIGFAEESSLTLGGFFARPRLTVQYPGAPERPLAAFPGRAKDLDDNRGPVIGMVTPGRDLFDRDFVLPWAMGVGLYLPGESLFTLRGFRDDELVSVMFQERNLAAGLVTYGAVRVLPWLSLGAGMTFNLANPSTLEGLSGIDGDIHYSTEVDTQLSPSLVAGIQLRPTRKLFFGARFLQRQRWNQQGTLRNGLVFDRGAPLIPPVPTLLLAPFEYDLFSSFTPMTLGFGMAYQVSERLQLDAAITYYRWSEYRTTAGTRPPNEFDDIWVPRLGIEYRLRRTFAVRGGFYFEPTPVSDQPPGFNLLGADRYVPSVGFEWRFRDPFGYFGKPIALEVAGFMHFLKTREFDEATAPPPLADLPPGELAILALLVPDFAAQADVDEPHTLRGRVFGVTATLTFSF